MTVLSEVTPPTCVSYRLVGNELGSHGERHDQDSGRSRPQHHGGRIHPLTHPVVQQHPGGEGQDQQQAQEVGDLDQSEQSY